MEGGVPHPRDRRAGHAVVSGLLDLLFPITCVGCGRYSEPTSEVEQRNFGSRQRRDDAERWLCSTCRARIAPPWLRCIACGTAAPSGRTCHACRRTTPLLGITAVGPYHDPILRTAVHGLKFRGVRGLVVPLGELLAARLVAAGMAAPDMVLVPLPLHPRRERGRGFNQARLLVEALGARLQLPFRDLLVRTRATSPQTSVLARAVRRQNVARVFALAVAAEPLPLRAILVDDVLTTGATLTEAAKVLAVAGVRDLWGAALAHG